MFTGLSGALDDALWRTLVDQLDDGVIIFSQQGLVTYANEAAADLLDYTRRELLGLDREDFLALCQMDRLDARRLAKKLLTHEAAEESTKTYTVATVSRRLHVRPLRLVGPEGPQIAIILHDYDSWHADAITEISLGELQSPLAFAASYAEMLVHRINDKNIHIFELRDLARIIRDSINQIYEVWDDMAALYGTYVHIKPNELEPVDLKLAVDLAVHELQERTVYHFPGLRVDVPDDLPLLRASPDLLHAGLCALLEGAAARINDDEFLTLYAHDQNAYVQVDLTTVSSATALQAYLFDELPFAIAEQVIVRHGGRIWFSNPRGGAPRCSFSLPVWSVG